MNLQLKERTERFSEYELIDQNISVGKIQIRNKASHAADIPEAMASHLYAEIKEEYRGKGYGKEILRLGLQEAKKFGLTEVYATCFEDNLASKGIIEANGGIFIEEVFVPAE